MRRGIVTVAAAAMLLGAVSSASASLKQIQDRLYDSSGIELAGFVESRLGTRIDRDQDEKRQSIKEARLQLDLGRDFDWGLGHFKVDFVADGVEEKAASEIREANLQFSPLEWMDLKVGRQVLTWGTGDLLFINDMFPKDWESFFIGRDDENLKAPSDAVKASFFTEAVNFDLVWTPVMNNSTYIDGSRISYYNSVIGRVAGRDYIFADDERNQFIRDSEFALRASRTVNGVELALYSYYGFWKTPEGVEFTPAPRLFYPRLTEYGASVRGELGGGIANVEAGYYDSLEDSGGGDPFVRNSEVRFLAGYEHELARDFTGAVQYYLEWMQDYSAYEASLPVGMPAKDEYRHLLTLRLTKLMLQQNLRLSLFTYYSPSDHDYYLRPKANYKVSDHWTVETGANIFGGRDDYTFWGQFEDNSNVYLAARYGF